MVDGGLDNIGKGIRFVCKDTFEYDGINKLKDCTKAKLVAI